MHWSSHLKCTLRAQCIFGPVKFEFHGFGEHNQNISWIAYFTENQDKANRARDSVLICKQTPNWRKRQQTHCPLKKLKMSLWKFNDIRPSMVLQCSIVAGKSCKKKSWHYYCYVSFQKAWRICSQPSFLFWKIGLEKRIFKTVQFKVQNTIGGGVSKENVCAAFNFEKFRFYWTLLNRFLLQKKLSHAWPILNFQSLSFQM